MCTERPDLADAGEEDRLRIASHLCRCRSFFPQIFTDPVTGYYSLSQIGADQSKNISAWKSLIQDMTGKEAHLRQEKVKKFEDFVDRRLKPDLVKAIAQRDKVFHQQQIFLDLKRNIENLEKNGITSLRSMVNLGSEVYMQAEVPDTQHIFVDIGLGFHVEFTWSEALEFISVREARLGRQIDEYTHLIASIKAQIKLVCEGIRELLEVSAE